MSRDRTKLTISEPKQERLVSVGLEHCAIYHPQEYNHRIEVVVGPPPLLPSLRHFPRRVQSGLGICLKTGSDDDVNVYGKTIVYPENSISVTPPGCVWEGLPSSAAFLSIDIEPAHFLTGTSFCDQMTFLLPSEFPSIQAAAATLAGKGDRLEKDEAIAALVAPLTRLGIVREAVSESGPERAGLRLVRDLLHDGYAKRLTLEALAKASGLNKYTLIRKFHTKFGLTPYAYQLKVRLAEGQMLLSQDLTVADTANALGFSDQSHFGRFFKKQYGITPQTYRNHTRVI